MNKIVSKVKVINVGDLLVGNGILKCGLKDDGSYNFDKIFKYITPYIKKSDLAVINLETSYSGKEPYKAFPLFNSPFEMIDSCIKSGFNAFLTASNHSYDLGYDALIKRIEYLESKNLFYIGTRKNKSDKLHKIIEINGIKIGMLNYTKVTKNSTKDRVVLNTTRKEEGEGKNYVFVDKKAMPLISYYDNKRLDEFYEVVQNDINELKNDGAEVIIAYMHWGREYQIDIPKRDRIIAQKLCDFGVDVIVGAHPHVIEPVKCYHSMVSNKNTICIHSVGNFISAMNEKLNVDNNTYVRDGALFGFNINKYSDGSIIIDDAYVLPTYMYRDENKDFFVLPLDKDNMCDNYNEESYDRTNDLVKVGIHKYNKIPKIIGDVKLNKSNKTTSCEVNVYGDKYINIWQSSKDNNKWKFVSFKKKLCINNNSDKYYRCIVQGKYGKSISNSFNLKSML